MYSPPTNPIPPMVQSLGMWSTVMSPLLTGTAPSGAAWYSANGAIYMPILVPATCVARRLWWVNSSTVSASYNLDCGIYADAGGKPGVKLVSTGSTAQGTASEVQFADITDTTLTPGVHWLALSCSSTSATLFRWSPADASRNAALKFEEASAVPLPATATPAESGTSTAYPIFGFATTASP